MRKIYCFWLLVLLPAITLAQEYQLVWEDNFDGTTINADVWNVETQVGIWNTGSNRELQHYRAENVSVGPDGFGNNALILTAKREVYNGYQFTSGRVNTRYKVAARYGKIEARIKLPVLANGLWPAFWTLGTQNGWPACGEIDILEAGHQQGITNNQQERTFNGALHWQHDGNYAGYGPQVVAPAGTSLYDYNKFTLVWTPSRIEMFLNDGTTPYFAMDITGTDAEEFRNWPHYFIFNLAVGGSFPGITNPANITAPLPANMYVDYIRVYQKQGEGELVVTPPVAPPSGNYYGVYTENPAITDKFVIDDVVNHLYTWENSLFPIENAPSYDGNDVLAFYAPASRTWFGFGLNANQGVDLRHFSDGYLHFALRTSSNVNFWVGVGGKGTTEAKFNFNNGSDPFGFVRNGQWHRIVIPVSQIVAQGVDLSQSGNLFMLGGAPNITDILVDDVYFSKSADVLANTSINPNRNNPLGMPDNKIVADVYGIYTENPNVTTRFNIDDVTGHIFIWENTLADNATNPYDGTDVISYRSQGGAGWWGFGIHDDLAHDLTHFANGYLAFSMKTTSQQTFEVGVVGTSGATGLIQFKPDSDPYGFVRDGKWHRVLIPVQDLIAKGLNLSGVGIVFRASGSVISDIAFDDIIYTFGASQPENPNINPDDDNGGDDGITSDYYGIFTERASITKKFNIDNVTGHLYLWNNLVASTGQTPYEGSELLAFQSPGAGWSGFGIFSGVPLDLSHYATGYLNFAIKIPSGSTQAFTVLMEGKENTKGEILFAPGADPYGVKRDGSWYFVSAPMGQLTGQGLNLSACGNIFAVASGAPTPGYLFDDVYLSVSKPTSIYKPSVETGNLKLYPNPASETFNVYSENGIKTIIVSDVSGKTIFQQLISSPGNTMPVNSSGWNKGLFLVEVIDQSGYKNISKIRIK